MKFERTIRKSKCADNFFFFVKLCSFTHITMQIRGVNNTNLTSICYMKRNAKILEIFNSEMQSCIHE